MKLSKIISKHGTFEGEHRLPTGTTVMATESELFCYSRGDTGTVVHYDRDGDMWVKFDSNNEDSMWSVTTRKCNHRPDGQDVIVAVM